MYQINGWTLSYKPCMRAKKGSLATPTGDQAPINTPEANSGTAPVETITQNSADINRNFETDVDSHDTRFSRELPQGSESIIPYAELESRSEGGTRPRPRRRPEMPELFG